MAENFELTDRVVDRSVCLKAQLILGTQEDAIAQVVLQNAMSGGLHVVLQNTHECLPGLVSFSRKPHGALACPIG